MSSSCESPQAEVTTIRLAKAFPRGKYKVSIVYVYRSRTKLSDLLSFFFRFFRFRFFKNHFFRFVYFFRISLPSLFTVYFQTKAEFNRLSTNHKYVTSRKVLVPFFTRMPKETMSTHSSQHLIQHTSLKAGCCSFSSLQPPSSVRN